MQISGSTFTMEDRTGFVIAKAVVVTDCGDTVGINGTLHRRDELVISEGGNQIVVQASGVTLTR